MKSDDRGVSTGRFPEVSSSCKSPLNIHGGGIALGHPLGATGIRLVGTLAGILEEQDGQFGCATACIGGGQGISIILERAGYR